LFLTDILSTAAVLLGVNLVNLVQPGQSLSQAQSERLRTRYGEKARTSVEKAKLRKDLRTTVVDLLPENPLQEMVGALDGSSKGNGMLAVMVFALIFGAGAAASPQACQTVVRALQGLYAISMTVIGFAMQIAPLGAGCLVFSLTAQLGLEILETLLWFVVAAIAGLAIQEFIVYSLVVRFLGGMSPGRFFRSISEAMLVALGTSSSNATLPTAMRVAETNLGLPRRVANFVLTVGATGNQNGTALFEGVVVLFLAQAMRIELTLAQQFTVVLMAVLAGVGTAGVPGGSLPMIVVVMTSVGIPGEAIGMVLGVDRLLDMCRTVVNVSGDLVIATCVAHSERCANPVAGSDTA
jgi:DAACS family dicarboxylate/amino acid:cation (Na+ or H+) symporter